MCLTFGPFFILFFSNFPLVVEGWFLIFIRGGGGGGVQRVCVFVTVFPLVLSLSFEDRNGWF